jgi:hypothetical protein
MNFYNRSGYFLEKEKTERDVNSVELGRRKGSTLLRSGYVPSINSFSLQLRLLDTHHAPKALSAICYIDP